MTVYYMARQIWSSLFTVHKLENHLDIANKLSLLLLQQFCCFLFSSSLHSFHITAWSRPGAITLTSEHQSTSLYL